MDAGRDKESVSGGDVSGIHACSAEIPDMVSGPQCAILDLASRPGCDERLGGEVGD